MFKPRFGILNAFAHTLVMTLRPSIERREPRRKSTKRVKRSWNTPHCGVKQAARNKRHAEAGTHGLKMVDGHAVFG